MEKLFTTSNADYGIAWQSTNGEDPKKKEVQIPSYREIADKARSQKVGLQVLKHQILLEKRQQDAEMGKEDIVYYNPEAGLKP